MKNVAQRVLRQDVRFRARCAAFSGEGVRENRIMVTYDGQVKVWDDVAEHYTSVHSLSTGAKARLVRAAVLEFARKHANAKDRERLGGA